MARAIFNGQVIAESERFHIVEGNVYFPRESIDWACLPRRHDEGWFCGWKGSAEYFDVEVAGQTAQGGAWHYPEPFDLCDYLKDHFAFWRGVEVRL